jgi:tetratricopeptide (TPR) repeat protein
MDSLEFIDNYFKGQLLPEQIWLFEKRIIEDTSFAEEVSFYLTTMKVARDQLAEDKKKRFREIYDQGYSNGKIKPVFRIRRYLGRYAAAAAVIAALAVGWYVFSPSPTSRELADQYIEQKLNTLGVKMTTTEDRLQTGKRLYDEGKIREALQQFEIIVGSDPSNSYAKQFAGVACLRLEQYDKALEYFMQLESHKNLYSNPAIFYQALTLMKRNLPGDKRRAKLLLQQVVEKNLERKSDAQALLDKL